MEWECEVRVTGYYHCIVEADTEEDAWKIAENRAANNIYDLSGMTVEAEWTAPVEDIPL